MDNQYLLGFAYFTVIFMAFGMVAGLAVEDWTVG